MSDLDLTAAVEAAALAHIDRLNGTDGTIEWDRLNSIQRLGIREHVLGYVTAAAPIIEEQVRERVAAEIEAEAHTHRCVVGESPFEGGTWSDGNDRGIDYGLDRAARIARGQR